MKGLQNGEESLKIENKKLFTIVDAAAAAAKKSWK
jgi:hypothetical protein